MQAMFGKGEPIRIKTLPPEDALVEDMKTRHGAGLVHAELRAERLLLVLDADSARSAERTRLAASTPRTEILDRAAWETLRRLAEAGVIGFTETRAASSMRPTPTRATVPTEKTGRSPPRPRGRPTGASRRARREGGDMQGRPTIRRCKESRSASIFPCFFVMAVADDARIAEDGL